jgi:hypothetical protein
MVGPPRQCMTHMARPGVLVERQLARWARVLAASPGDLQGVGPTLVRPLVRPLGASVDRWDAWLAAVETTRIAKGRGQRPGVQTGHDHRGTPARGASLVGPHGARIGLIAAWGTG